MVLGWSTRMISRKPPDYRAALPAWQTPLSDSSPSPSRRNPSGDALANCRRSIRIIGIDPGLRRTGWGVIDTDGVRLVYVACGVILSDDAAQLGLRLRQLVAGPSAGVARLSPPQAAIAPTLA